MREKACTRHCGSHFLAHGIFLKPIRVEHEKFPLVITADYFLVLAGNEGKLGSRKVGLVGIAKGGGGAESGPIPSLFLLPQLFLLSLLSLPYPAHDFFMSFLDIYLRNNKDD